MRCRCPGRRPGASTFLPIFSEMAHGPQDVRECSQPADSGSPTSHATGKATPPQQASCARSIWSSYVPVSGTGSAAATPPKPPKPARQIARPLAATILFIVKTRLITGISPGRTQRKIIACVSPAKPLVKASLRGCNTYDCKPTHRTANEGATKKAPPLPRQAKRPTRTWSGPSGWPLGHSRTQHRPGSRSRSVIVLPGDAAPCGALPVGRLVPVVIVVVPFERPADPRRRRKNSRRRGSNGRCGGHSRAEA